MAQTAPFSHFEFMIAWRYLRAKRAEGGVSVMTWISLIGITLAVFALIATLAVRAGFRAEFVDTILGANAHVTVYASGDADATGRVERGFGDYDAVATRIAAVPGVTRAAPLVKGQVMATANGVNMGAEVFGIRTEDIRTIPRVGDGADAEGHQHAHDEMGDDGDSQQAGLQRRGGSADRHHVQIAHGVEGRGDQQGDADDPLHHPNRRADHQRRALDLDQHHAAIGHCHRPFGKAQTIRYQVHPESFPLTLLLTGIIAAVASPVQPANRHRQR